MLLRASSEISGGDAKVAAITDPSAAAESGVPHAAELLAFAEAVVEGDDASLDAARSALLAAVGPEGLVDAAGVVGNFQRMVRIADGTGIPLDAPIVLMTIDMRRELGLNEYGSAANTPEPGALPSAIARLLSPVVSPLFRTIARFYRG